MKKLFIIIIILIILTSLVYAKLSDETLKTVETLRFKQYCLTVSIDLNFIGIYNSTSNTIEWNRDFLSIWVEDGKLFVETQDGKWYIEMKKTKGEDD